MHQLRHDDVSAWYQTFKSVTKMGQFLLRTVQYIFLACGWFSVFKVPASTLLQRLKDADLILFYDASNETLQRRLK